MTKLSHIDDSGRARMVDVSDKPATAREALAKGLIRMSPQTLALAIPMCHPLILSSIKVQVDPISDGSGLEVSARVKTVGPTGVEMEALTAVSVALLTLYDMLKAADRTMTIEAVRLVEKTGGASGLFRRAEE